VKGKKKLSFKPKRAVEIEFKPNAFQPILNVFSFRAPDEVHDFDHEAKGFVHMAEEGAALLCNVSAAKYPGRNPEGTIIEGFKSMAHLLLAKKLTYAVASEIQTAHYDDFKVIKNSDIEAPAFMKVFAEGYGRFEHEGVDFKPRDAPLHQFDHFAQAVGVINLNGISNTKDKFFVNSRMHGWHKLVRARSARIVSRWCSDAPTWNATLNGTVFPVKPPEPINGTPFPRTWTTDLAAVGVPPPPDVAAHAELVAHLDSNVFVMGPRPVAALLPPFGRAGYRILDWNAMLQGSYLTRYLGDVEMRQSALWRTAFSVETVRQMEPKGRPWQLVSVQEDVMLGQSSFSVSAADQITAYLLARSNPNVGLSATQARFGVGEKTPQGARVEVIRKACVTKEFI